MRTIQKKESSNYTLNPSPTNSLFKFDLFFADRPKLRYWTFDKPHERKQFYPGLDKVQREKWRGFLGKLEEGLPLDFFGSVYPEFKNDNEDVTFHFAKMVTTVDFLNDLAKDEDLTSDIKKMAEDSGFRLTGYKMIEAKADSVRPDITPKYFNRYELYAMTQIRPWAMRKFMAEGLIEIRVFDNLCYHSENLITSWYFEENLKRFSEKQKVEPTTKPVQQLGNFIKSNISQFEQAKR